MKKHDIAHAVVVAVIFTCLLAFLLMADPGTGFEGSPLMLFDIELFFSLVKYGFIIYLVALVCLLIFCSFLDCFLDDGEKFSNSFDSFEFYIITAIIIYCLAIVFGYITPPGGFSFE